MVYCVPDLKFDIFVVYAYESGSELNSDSYIVLFTESLLYKLHQKARFSHS